MKKLVMFVTMLALGTCLWAGDVYSLKMVSKVPVIKEASTFYKDFTTTTYNGYVEISYNDDGTAVSLAPAVIYGDFNGVLETREVLLSLDVFNVYGKKVDNTEMSFSCDLGNGFVVTLCGKGKVKTTTVKPTDSCGDAVACVNPTRLDTADGNFTGLINVVCDPCGGNHWAWLFCYCPSVAGACGDEGLDMIPASIDIVYGTWGLRYNKSLSQSCVEVGFPACVYPKIPAKYLPSVE